MSERIEPVLDEKSLLRRKFIRQRQELTVSDWQSRSDRICVHLANCPQVIQAQTILAYYHHRQEPSLHYLFTQTSQQWGLPRSVGKELLWHRWQPPEPLVTGKYGILEPDPASPRLTPDLVDLMLIPAVAMATNGYRLGYGGGYYDRLRADPRWQQIPTIGIVFDFAHVPALPIDPWDLPLDAICTESGFTPAWR